MKTETKIRMYGIIMASLALYCIVIYIMQNGIVTKDSTRNTMFMDANNYENVSQASDTSNIADNMTVNNY